MNKYFKRVILTIFVLLWCTLPNLADEIGKYIKQSDFELKSTVGVYVVDNATNKVLYKRNEQKRFIINNFNEERRRQEKSANQALLGLGIFILLMFGIGIGIPSIEHRKNIKELKETESQLSQAIINEDYDLALILANQLYYTSNWSKEEEKAWDSKRENYIAIIEEKQGKKAK